MTCGRAAGSGQPHARPRTAGQQPGTAAPPGERPAFSTPPAGADGMPAEANVRLSAHPRRRARYARPIRSALSGRFPVRCRDVGPFGTPAGPTGHQQDNVVSHGFPRDIGHFAPTGQTGHYLKNIFIKRRRNFKRKEREEKTKDPQKNLQYPRKPSRLSRWSQHPGIAMRIVGHVPSPRAVLLCPFPSHPRTTVLRGSVL